MTDIVGLYLAPPENAIVLCIDEISQIQALDRTAPMLPMQLGLPERRTHYYKRHRHDHAVRGTGDRHRQGHRPVSAAAPAPGVPALLQTGREGLPEGELHVVMYNYAAHKHIEIRGWLAANPRVTVLCTPTSASWIDMVEIWFGIIKRQASHGGTSARSTTSTPRSAPSSTAGTTAPTPSPGPRPQIRSSPKPSVQQLLINSGH